MEELLQHFVSRSIADKKKSNDLELVRHNSWWNLCKIFDQIMADLLDRSCQKRYIKSWVKKCLTKSWHMYLIKFWQIYLNKSWQQCYIKSWLIYLTAMLYQILAKSITFGQDWWVAQKARGEARTSLHVTWLKRKNVNRIFFFHIQSKWDPIPQCKTFV